MRGTWCGALTGSIPGWRCSAAASPGASSADDGDILGEIRDGDGLDTLIRKADEHRPRCEWAAGAGDEGERQELTADERAEVHLTWVTGSRAGQRLAVLHRLDYNVWDAWQHPSYLDGQAVEGLPPVRLTRNGVSYELALMAVFRAMGEAMPEEFAVLYPPFELPAEQRTPSEAPLPMSYARYLIRRDDRGLSLECSGQTGGVFQCR